MPPAFRSRRMEAPRQRRLCGPAGVLPRVHARSTSLSQPAMPIELVDKDLRLHVLDGMEIEPHAGHMRAGHGVGGAPCDRPMLCHRSLPIG